VAKSVEAQSGALPETVPEETLSIPYLPDVLGRGVRFARFFQDPAIWRRQDWPTETGEWWDRQPIRVVMVQGSGPAPVTPVGGFEAPLWDEATRTEYTVRFRWAPGSVAFWDNRATAHLVPTDIPDGFHRSMQRITIAGDVPVGPDGSTSYALTGETFG